MAITIRTSAPTYAPVYNPMFFMVNSTNTAQANFQFLCDVYITGQTFAGASYLRLKTTYDTSIGGGVFDVGRILERYLSYDIDDTTYSFQPNTNSILEYTLQFGEEYGPSSGVTQYASLTSSSAKYAFNASMDFLDRYNYVATNYIGNSVTRKQLTSHPTNSASGSSTSIPVIYSTQPIRQNESAWTSVLVQSSGDVKFAEVRTYDNLDSIIATYKIMNVSNYDTSTVGNRSLRFPTGWNLNSITNSDMSGGVQPILVYGQTLKWRVRFMDSSSTSNTEQRWYSEDSNCTNHSVYHLYFLNKLGNFDTFSFTKANQFSTEIKRSKYEKSLGKSITATSYGYEPKDRLDTNFYTEMKDTIHLNSDWVNEDTITWLEELVSSPTIYHADATYGIVPVNVIDTKFTRRQHLTDKIFNLTIDIQYSYTRFRQRS